MSESNLFFIGLAAALGYLIFKKLDEKDLYVTKIVKKSRTHHRDLQGTESIIQRESPIAHSIQKTTLGIPMIYWEFANGTKVRTYGKDETVFNNPKDRRGS